MPRSYRSLKAGKIRPDWNKYTLFNLSRLSQANNARLTFFQQKWRAKSALRAYHSPYVREKKWERLFDRRLPGVVPMDYKYLARNDGSELAAGRGSGLVIEEEGRFRVPGKGAQRFPRTPYMGMAFFPLERRLDTAIWRALFASSSKQARQMVTHGSVKVNGKKMIYPGYLLNPGDMFSIDPDKVMYATGARKTKKNSPLAQGHKLPARVGQHPLIAAKTTDEKEAAKTEEEEEPQTEDDQSAPESGDLTESRRVFRKLRSEAKKFLEEQKGEISGKRKGAIRTLVRDVQVAMSRFNKVKGQEDVEGAKATVEELEKVFEALNVGAAAPTTSTSAEASAEPKGIRFEARKDAELLAAALERVRENPEDASKPYATPWRPRPYMSAFAFIPRYLEVNQNICHAVYLRHPVARPGLAEVPSPLEYETAQLGFNWYLRRR